MPHPTVNYPPGELLLGLHRRRGSLLISNTGGRRTAYALGSKANEFVLANDGLFRVGEAYAGLIPVDGPTALIVSDGADHRRRRALVRPGLTPRQVEGYLATMSDCADDALDSAMTVAGPGGAFDAYETFRRAIRRSTMRSLFGERIAQRADDVGADLQPLLDLIDGLPDLVALHERLGSPTWRRAMAARGRLDDFVYGEIARARSATPTSADGCTDTGVLATLVHGRDGSGSGLSDAEVRDQVVSMIAAGYETTSAAMGWAVYALGGHPEAMARARAEVADVTAGAPPTSADLPGLEWVCAIVTETLRLYPPAVIAARYLACDVEFEGRQLRAGTTLVFSPYVTHRSPEIYDAPREFRPQRWLGERRRPASEYLPFGGGAHRCVGATMATTELTVMLARLLSRPAYAVQPGRVRAKGYAAMRPGNGLRISLPAES